jgi:ElaB/YqjD/DUF883 family membrane-anchored ribosome-binding protein
MGAGKVCTDIGITIIKKGGDQGWNGLVRKIQVRLNRLHHYFEEMNMGIHNLAVDKTEETAGELQGSGKSTGFENVKNSIADKLHCLAEGLGKNAADQDSESARAHYVKQASEWLDYSAGYVREFDYKQTDDSIREYVKQSPGRSLFIAGAVGLIIGAILQRR